MQRLKFAVFVVVALACLPSMAEAQEQSQEIQAEAKSWVDTDCLEHVTEACWVQYQFWVQNEEAWKARRKVTGNYVMFRGIYYRVYQRPEPPAWLVARCNLMVASKGPIEEMCEVYKDYLRYDWVSNIEGPVAQIVYTRITASKAKNGEGWGVRTFLLKNVHLDGMWTNSSNSKLRFYGVVGTHLTLAHVNRFDIWGAPGLILMILPNGQVRLMSTMGVDIFLGQVKVPFLDGERAIYLTFAKVYNAGDQLKVFHNRDVGKTMVGLSVTWVR